MKEILISSLLILVGSLFFVSNDAIINYLSPIGIKFYHFVFYGSPAFLSVPLYLLITGNFKKKLKTSNYFIPLLRSFIFAPMPFITFISLKNMSLPEYTTLNMSAPIIASFYGLLLLKEKVNLYLLISLFFGVIGVLFVVQPGFDTFNPFFLLVIFSTFLITATTVLVNKYNNVTSSIGFFIYGGIVVHLLSLFLFIFDPLIINLEIFGLITISSILINAAMLITTNAFQRSQKYYSSIFCLVYIQILYSVLIGYFVFGEYLNFLALIGAILIVFSGIFSIPSQYKQINE
tara:strand:+ start:717 stop:1586 length:870 start_codon:yes stop_codon:yes gene_type:complete